MNPDEGLQTDELPSKRRLAKTTAIALVVAAGILVTVVLPAEYGIDPLGTGAALGLMPLSGTSSEPEKAVTPGSAMAPPVQEGPVAHYAAEYKFDSTELALGPYEYLEYKYRLEKGASMLYSWTASATVIHDFHGEPEGAPSESAESFDKRGRTRAHGSFSAPFSGIHGWYWENPGGETITIRLTTTGFYSSAQEIRSDRTRHPHELTTLESITGARKPNPAAVP